ncbi:MAG: polysaccharide lyase [Myxococcota bacterium]
MRGSSWIAAIATALIPASAGAAPVWVGDIETGDLSQFTNVLNEQVDGKPYAQPAMDVVLEGDFAARLELQNDAEWSNGLRRVELQHRPDDARTAEGQSTFFAWSFYLPEALPGDPGHSLGYWESANSFQQMMAFNTEGQDIRFITQQPYTEHWYAQGVVTPGQWHRIVMRVLWSTDPQQGEVDVWFDGEQVVTAVQARTLADDNPHFIQIGLLRSDTDIATVPVVYIDAAAEGDSLEDVDPADEPGGTGTDTGDDDTAGDTAPGDETAGGDGDPDTSGGTPMPGTTGGDGGPAGDDTGAMASSGGDGGTSGAANDGDATGCSCRQRPQIPWFSWLALALVGMRRRRG